jgi:hypothetical protein
LISVTAQADPRKSLKISEKLNGAKRVDFIDTLRAIQFFREFLRRLSRY